METEQLLESILTEIADIKHQLTIVVRLEERTGNHDTILVNITNRLENHADRLRSVELWEANHGDKAASERTIDIVYAEIKKNSLRLTEIEKTTNTRTGQIEVSKGFLKWALAIVSGVLIFMLTKG